MSQNKLSHLDETGRVAMVDVADKEVTDRIATAQGRVVMAPDTLRLILANQTPKGNVIEIARIAGIMGAKRTHDLIPLCHPLAITKVDIDIEPDESAHALNVTASVRVSGKTGVEMEALTAVSIACLTIYDMAKAVDKAMVIGDIRLTHKSGGKSGRYDAA
ncbi:MAG: cyclic pyranopterin monophosphate synthase MoaC [Alphaproteobacteria bacterium]|nr:cyclic pyranopterin monophosphate synthase MoaC [Rhodobiaceae bacterium]MBO6542042.1 cyclic pyranopterin monophosphate synthase MoaC [Alphaproteobacteria bacterium]MBO6628211.1 cyclic pyranopterin monophosphate synthase MoaC [Alphaproteobacteria bacterium]MDF1625101.1 cyclic pyranopterin monophosphate synthase MoaC [Parvibaculaceae bacterium]